MWFATFHKFTRLNADDGKFADFLAYFREMADSTDINELYGVEKGAPTKDRSVVVKKLEKLESLMHEYLGIPAVGMDSDDALDKSALLDFIRENVAAHVTDEDASQYGEVLQALVYKLDKPSALLEPDNKPSLLAMVAHSFENDIDLDSWFLDFFARNGTYIPDQKENFELMKGDLEQFSGQIMIA